MNKKLYKSRTDKALSGVCAGLAEYLNIDVVVVRLLAVILCFMSFGTVLVAYIVAAVIMPEEPGGVRTESGARQNVYETTYEYREESTGAGSDTGSGSGSGDSVHFEGGPSADYGKTEAPRKKSSGSWVIGLALIILGAYMILEWLFPWLFYWLSWRIVGAGILITVGVYVLTKRN